MSLTSSKIKIFGQPLAELCDLYREKRIKFIIAAIMKDVIANNGGKNNLVISTTKKNCDASHEE